MLFFVTCFIIFIIIVSYSIYISARINNLNDELKKISKNKNRIDEYNEKVLHLFKLIHTFPSNIVAKFCKYNNWEYKIKK